jgi:hypothetical protein
MVTHKGLKRLGELGLVDVGAGEMFDERVEAVGKTEE